MRGGTDKGQRIHTQSRKTLQPVHWGKGEVEKRSE